MRSALRRGAPQHQDETKRIQWRAPLVALLGGLIAGCSGTTSVTVVLTSDTVPSLRSLELTAHAVGEQLDTTASQVIAPDHLTLPLRLRVVVPADTTEVTVSLTGIDSFNHAFNQMESAVVRPHGDVTLSFVFNDSTADSGVALSGDAHDGGARDNDGGDGAGCGSCAAPHVCCGGVCIDPTSDPQNCGGCGQTCASGTCGAAVTTTMSSLPPDWTFNTGVNAMSGSFYDPSNAVGVLTNDQIYSLGSIVFQHPITTDAFEARFDFRITHAATTYADGIGFALIKNDPTVTKIDTAVGLPGGGLGMMAPKAAGSDVLLSGYGVELDTFDNDNPDGNCGEFINGDHVNVDVLSQCYVASGSVPTPLATPIAITFGDGQWHTADVKLANGKLSVSLTTGMTVQPLFAGVPLIGFQSGDSYYFAFTGACGGFSARQEIRNISIVFPTARCL